MNNDGCPPREWWIDPDVATSVGDPLALGTVPVIEKSAYDYILGQWKAERDQLTERLEERERELAVATDAYDALMQISVKELTEAKAEIERMRKDGMKAALELDSLIRTRDALIERCERALKYIHCCKVSIIGTVEGCSNEKETRKALAEIAKFREQK